MSSNNRKNHGENTRHIFTTVPIKTCWISCAFFQFVLRNTGKMSGDKILKTIKFENEILLQYYHEQVISVVDRVKMLSDVKLIIKLSNSSVGDNVYLEI